MTAVDAHYTPAAIARDLADALCADAAPSSVVDFAAGDGALLDAVTTTFPQVQVSANDAHGPTVQRLRIARPTWRTSCSDFLNTRSRVQSLVGNPSRRYDSVVLNPPFSYRGSRALTSPVVPRCIARCSPAAAFVVLAARYVSDDGELLALLPASTLESEKDQTAWLELSHSWSREVLTTYRRGAFPSLAAKVLLVRMRRKPADRLPLRRLQIPRVDDRPRPIQVRLVRGCTPRHAVKPTVEGRAFLHTTGLTRNGLVYDEVDYSGGRATTGPAVLLARVGNPAPWKIVVRTDHQPALLSDCVVALECDSEGTAYDVAGRMVSQWPITARAWNGSCAPYTTLARLRAMLEELAVEAVYEQPSSAGSERSEAARAAA